VPHLAQDRPVYLDIAEVERLLASGDLVAGAHHACDGVV
jgi:hypothetical protein